MYKPSRFATGTILGSLAFVLAGPVQAADDELNPKELLNLSLEQLTNIEVTSVSKKSEKASEAAAAIFVITQDDIRRSGMTSIPELLRIVPGLSVAQMDSHDWAITSRGTSSQFANKLLVLIDGRSVYTPLFAGVYWEVQDMPLQDIERIEVIRGPGATLWGANAVNGVINIITKSAKDTQGTLLSQSVGNIDNSLSMARYGGKINDSIYGRVYAKYDDRDDYKTLTNTPNEDSWNKIQSGFRVDGKSGEDISYTLQGDIYDTGESLIRYLPTLGAPFINVVNDREHAKGANILGRLNYKDSKISDWTLQMYFDNGQRDNVAFSDNRNTFDIDFQRSWTQDRHEIVWGAGYRMVYDAMDGTTYIFLSPRTRADNLFSAFIQDKIALVPEEFFVTLGSKFEHNDYTGFEMQPSARLTWLVDKNQTLWASAAHAVKTPYRISDDVTFVLSQSGGAFLGAEGSHATESEKLNAYELGYRIQPLKTLSLDATTFYNDYGKLVTSVLGDPIVVNFPGIGATPYLPIYPVNANSGTTTGFEIAANWDATDSWQIEASYTRLNFVLKNPESASFTVKGYSPKNQFNIRSSLRLMHDVELDNSLYYVSKLTGPDISAYTRFDTRLAWKPIESMEVSFVGQNMFHDVHREFTSAVYGTSAAVPRSYYGNITWKF